MGLALVSSVSCTVVAGDSPPTGCCRLCLVPVRECARKCAELCSAAAIADAKPLLSAEPPELPWVVPVWLRASLLVPVRLRQTIELLLYETGETCDFLLSSPLLCHLLCCALLFATLCELSARSLCSLYILPCAISFFHALQLPVPSNLSALGSHCSSSQLSSPTHRPRLPKSCFSGSCTGCSRPHVDYAISIVSAPYRVSESFCVSAPNTHSTSLRV